MAIKMSWVMLVQIYLILHVAVSVSISTVVSGFAATPYIRLVYIVLYTVLCFMFLWNIRSGVVLGVGGVNRIFYIYIALFPIWLFLGFLDFGFYVVTDAYYAFFGILVYFVFYNSLFHSKGMSLESRLYMLVAFGYSLVVVIFRYFRLSVPIEVIVALSMFLLIYIFFGRVFIWRAIFFIIIGFFLATSNRAYLLQVLFIVYLYFCALIGVFRVTLISVVAFFAALACLTTYSYEVEEFFKGTALDRRVSETLAIIETGSVSGVSLPMMQREYEASQVESFFKENMHYILMGKGYGATLDMSGSEDDSVVGSQLVGAEETHNIHYLHYAIFYRYGVVGLVLFILFFLHALAFLYRRLRSYRLGKVQVVEVWSSSIVVAMFIFSMFASSFVFSNPLWLMGLAGVAYYGSVKKYESY